MRGGFPEEPPQVRPTCRGAERPDEEGNPLHLTLRPIELTYGGRAPPKNTVLTMRILRYRIAMPLSELAFGVLLNQACSRARYR